MHTMFVENSVIISLGFSVDASGLGSVQQIMQITNKLDHACRKGRWIGSFLAHQTVLPCSPRFVSDICPADFLHDVLCEERQWNKTTWLRKKQQALSLKK